MIMKRRILAVTGVVLLSMGVCVPAAIVTNTTPRGWDAACATNSQLVASLNAPFSGATNFVLHSNWRGMRSGSVTGTATRIVFTPDAPLLPGEMLESSLAGPATNFTWRFSAVPRGGSSFETNANSTVIDSSGAYHFRSIALADMNNDTGLEVIVPEWGTASILIATGNPTVTNQVTLAGSIQSVASGDFNCDGHPDMLLGCGSQVFVVATNSGSGLTFGVSSQTVSGVSGPLRKVAVGDLNGDGFPDGVAIAETSGHVIPLVNNGSGALIPGTPVACADPLYGLCVGDVDGNGTLDVVVVGPSGYLAILLNNGTGNLSSPSVYTVCPQILYTCRIADFNGDGYADIVAAGSEGVVIVGFGGPSGFTFQTLDHGLSLPTIYGLGIGDFDANGLPDIAVCGGDSVAVLTSTGANMFSCMASVVLPGEVLRDVATGDMNGDGRLDLTVGGLYSGIVYTLWNSPPSIPIIMGTNGASVVTGEPPDVSKGTDFGQVPVFSAVTNNFKLVNIGEGILQISDVRMVGVSASAFLVTNMPETVSPASTSVFSIVVLSSSTGTMTAVLIISNNSPQAVTNATSPYVLNLAAEVTKRWVNSLTISDTNQVYDGSNTTVVVSVSPSSLATNVNITYDGSTNLPGLAGSYTVVAEVVDTFYYGSQTSCLTIAKRELVATCQDAIRGYGETNPVFAISLTNFLNGEGISNVVAMPTASTMADVFSPVGQYAITGSGGAATNYSFSFTAGTLTVTQAVLIVQADDKQRVIGQPNPPLTISYIGWRNGDDTNDLASPPVTYTTAVATNHVGAYPIDVIGGSSTNYMFDRVPGTLRVIGVLTTVTLSNLVQTYDGTPKTAMAATIPPGLDVLVTYNSLTNAPVAAGDYAVTGVVTTVDFGGSTNGTMSILKADQAVISFLPTNGMYPADQLLTFSIVGASSGIPVSVAVRSGPAEMVSSNQLRFLGPGPVAVAAWQESNSNWNASAALTNWYAAVETNQIHYVAMAGQTSAWPYASWQTAASNIQAAVDLAGEGDVVLVGRGTYDTGGRIAPGSVLTNRLVVDKAISIRGVAGPSATFIVGHADVGSNAPLGAGAVRCVFMTNGAVLAGFTLTNGFTLSEGASIEDQSGGGAMLAAGSVVSDCVVAGNAALYGGGACGGLLTRCRVAGNTATFDGGGVNRSIVNNSLVLGNVARFGGGVFRGNVRQCSVAVNTAFLGGGTYECVVRNSIVYYNADEDMFSDDVEYTCAASGVIQGDRGSITNLPLFVNPGAGDLYLMHDSVCINVGTNVYVPTNAAGDLVSDFSGGPRIRYGRVDMGAFEYDATPDIVVPYAADNVTAHGFRANWLASTGTVTVRTYLLEVTNVVSGVTAVTQVSGAQTNRIVTGLDPGVVYRYRLQPTNEYSTGEWSSGITVTTLTESALDVPLTLNIDATYAGTNPAVRDLVFTNNGATACFWTGVVGYGGGASGWLNLSATGGVIAAYSGVSVTVAVDIAGFNAGHYIATNAVSSPNATNSPVTTIISLMISRGIDTIVLDNTNQVYNGSPRSVSAVSTQGATVTVTYGGSSSAPVAAGMYAVTGVVDVANWTAIETAVLTVSKASQTITSFLPGSGEYGSSNQMQLMAIGGGSTNPVVFAVVSGPGELFDPDRLRFTGYGTVLVTASQGGDSNWTAASVVTNAYLVSPIAGLTHYVAIAGQTPVWPYAQPATAASNIQAAVDAAWSNDCVLVGAGIYDNAGRRAPGASLMNRVYADKKVLIRSSNGPQATVIRGEAAHGGGNGAGAVRCAWLGSGAVLEGFTLEAGHTMADLDLWQDESGGGARVGDVAEVRRCLIVGNSAKEYGGGLFFENGGVAISSIVCSNSAARGGGVHLYNGGGIYNCTVVDNAATIAGGGAYLVNGGTLCNTVAWYNNAAGANNIAVGGIGWSVKNVCAADGVTLGVAGSITNEPMFADRLAGDYRLLSGSPCIDAGSNAGATGSLDFYGNTRIIGTVDIGAAEYASAPSIIVPGTVNFVATYGGAAPEPQVVVVSNAGAVACTWSNALAYGGGAAGWLTVTPTAGVLSGPGGTNITLSVTTTGLNVQAYFATNTITSAAATNSPQIFVVSLTVTRADQTIIFHSPGDRTVDAPVVLSATASSGLPVDYSVVSGPATMVSSNVVSFTNVGIVTIRGSQVGNGNFNAAFSTNVTFQVLPAIVIPPLSKLFWQLPTGQAACWLLNTNGTVKSTVLTYSGTTTWQIQGVGDLDTNGISDLIWQAPAGQVACWYMKMNGTSRSTTNFYTGSSSWIIRGAGDIDGDGIADLVWQLPTGQVGCWFMKTNGTAKSTVSTYTGVTPWVICGVGDIDGDGISDLIWQLPTGQVSCWLIKADGTRKSGLSIYTGTTPWIVAGVGDIDGDGFADLIWQLPTGQASCWLMNTNGTRKAGLNIYPGTTSWIIRGVGR